MFGFMWLFDSWSFIDCLLFGAIISATDPGEFHSHATLYTADISLISVMILVMTVIVLIVLSTWQTIARLHLDNAELLTGRQVAVDPETKPADLGTDSEFADKMLPLTATVAIFYYYLAWKLMHIWGVVGISDLAL